MSNEGTSLFFNGLGLTETDAEVLAWHYVDLLSLADIAEYLGVDKSTVYERLQKCIRILSDAGVTLPTRPVVPMKGPTIHLGGVSADYMDELCLGTADESKLIKRPRRRRE